MSFHFDPETHTYTLDGVRLVSVTEALKVITGDFYAKVPAATLERKRQIGVAVDQAITLWINGELDEASIHPSWGGYLNAFRAFWHDRGLTLSHVIENQRPWYCKKFKYAGTPDLKLRLDKRKALIDTKCTYAMHPATAIQTAGYAMMDDDWGDMDRFGLHLRENGTYLMEPYRDTKDFTVFLACLSLTNWRKIHGC